MQFFEHAKNRDGTLRRRNSFLDLDVRMEDVEELPGGQSYGKGKTASNRETRVAGAKNKQINKKYSILLLRNDAKYTKRESKMTYCVVVRAFI